ncbi:MBL fold metallo-hydrolase [Mycobacterium shigaense]|uniref:MBL fold metallo-hydrolase n=1 Tax=Mycobacterium shigaense TaxID=722731 RepID=A0A1Z4EPG8_9MYCO|nr:alkyl sulfatase dimerization domain-containing protein [Mycobacterium shigaense]PRI15451.1 MBL fold metallo-hydrolase [Mycobacterium shigaense]BAX94895.1 MBL fold metallo-hydrolase [Mycobacterium shigaense]
MVEPVYRSRPGADALRPASAEQAEQVAPGLWCSPGLSNAYLLTTADGRVIVNTGMGFEGPVHRANFDAVDSSPVRYIIFTQGHVDHVGGLDSVRDPDTTVVAQANWTTWRDDNERLLPYRASRSAFAFSDTLATGIQAIQRRLGTKKLPAQSVPTVDLDFEDTLTLEVGGRRLELISVPGGETTDSLVVWLPEERICLCGNTFGPIFGHIPNLVTMRGDRYRDALTAAASVERVRNLRPDLLVTGHFAPVAGADVIDAELTRLRDALHYIHDRTVAGMNAGKDVQTLMREIALPAEYEVGQGYGKVAWDVRAIWENYSGWFHHRSTTELYPIGFDAVGADLVELAGADALVDRARAHLAAGRPVHAVHLAEIVSAEHPDHPTAREVLREAHESLLEDTTNFWERAWLTRQIAKNS